MKFGTEIPSHSLRRNVQQNMPLPDELKRKTANCLSVASNLNEIVDVTELQPKDSNRTRKLYRIKNLSEVDKKMQC